MRSRELRKKKATEKAVKAIASPFHFLATHKLFLAAVIIVLILVGVMVANKVAPAATKLRGDVTAIGYLPDGEYEGTLDGKPVSFFIDRTAETADGRSWEVEMAFADGSSATYYLCYDHGDLHLSDTPKGALRVRGNVVEKGLNGVYTVTMRHEKSPWLEFSPK